MSGCLGINVNKERHVILSVHVYYRTMIFVSLWSDLDYYDASMGLDLFGVGYHP